MKRWCFNFLQLLLKGFDAFDFFRLLKLMKHSLQHLLKYILKLLSAIVLLTMPLLTKAQLNFDFQEGTFLIKGKVTDLQTKAAIPKTNVTLVNRRAGLSADVEGVFSMYVFPGDTLKFSSLGYISKRLVVANIPKDSIYNIHIELVKDFVRLKEVTIYPYRTVEEFKQAFMEAKDVNKVVLPGIAPPKYSTNIPRPKFTNPISFLYEKTKKRRAANPDFRP